MRYDLHTHTTASDGALAPQALLERAAACGVTHLAITDHDTLAAYDVVAPVRGLVLVAGIELSTHWRQHGVHVLGLNVDPRHPVLRAGVRAQQEARERRAATIAARLAKQLRIDDPLPAVAARAGGSGIGRPHFAAHLVELGCVRDRRAAYQKYLGDGKAGDVRQHWAPLGTVVDWIRAAGGVAVLAHPAHYGLTRTRLRALSADFRAAGGRALEVVSGRQDAATTARLAALAADHGLLASCGSDFHAPGEHVAGPGSSWPLPGGCRPVWRAWQ